MPGRLLRDWLRRKLPLTRRNAHRDRVSIHDEATPPPFVTCIRGELNTLAMAPRAPDARVHVLYPLELGAG